MKSDTSAAEGARPLPDIDDLAASLHFSPLDGIIWLGGRRMVLMHTRALGILRRELIEAVGHDRARALFTRQGHEAGAMDARFANTVRGNREVFDAFAVGPQLHALEGVVKVEPVLLDIDVPTGRFRAEYRWHNSSECEAHIEHFGIGANPACWSQLGYASGYASVFIGRPIIYREVRCKAMGFDHCHIVGRPAQEWDDDDLRYFRAENYAPAPASTPPAKWDMVGASSGFNVAFHLLQRVAKTSATVLFLGESGVGKEMFARNLHRMSLRAEQPFVAVNCAAIPETLVESELFGVEKGAFTGATASRAGRFERAEGGTLFLDEIGTLSLSAQGKLLRALQEHEIERVGGTATLATDVRVIAATNTSLEEAIAAGTFRSDLYYRLNVFPVRIPPLRERSADIPLLMDHFLRIIAARHGKAVTGFSQRTIYHMLGYDWPGNVRELENVIERGVILAEPGGPIELHHLFTSGERLEKSVLALDRTGGAGSIQYHITADVGRAADDGGPLLDNIIKTAWSLDDLSHRLALRALDQCAGNRSAAARRLGLTRSQFNYRLGKRAGASSGQ